MFIKNLLFDLKKYALKGDRQQEPLVLDLKGWKIAMELFYSDSLFKNRLLKPNFKLWRTFLSKIFVTNSKILLKLLLDLD